MPEYPFLEDEPPTFLSSGEKEWKENVRAICSQSLQHPCLRFVVSSWVRRYNYFDLDNIAGPVLNVVGMESSTVWVSMELGETPGVAISNHPPPIPSNLCQEPLYIRNPPIKSISSAALLPELEGQNIIGDEEPLGLILIFDSDETRIGDFSFEGPIKPLIDSFGPLLGTYHQSAKDYRIHEIRILKGHRIGERGVRVGFWFLPSI
ncbi:hypothetical protein [Ktedonobacter robiniae]|uniref:Uncharacterized protein n=1 Tax=Ktedonobacter robiniae TaxID=2778365 RepID=A0ABQ3UTN6_9CHLR|nr:hypothetical protein [Ktedonobacter robiniae]GHO56073.1 hypothetical protein KSB_45480 [Ktedonobacter robiniae]